MENKFHRKKRKSRINSAVTDLRLRIEKLEKEKNDLEEKVKQLKFDKNEEKDEESNSQLEKVHVEVLAGKEEMKTLQSQVQKLTSDFTMANYEAQAIAIENEGKRKKENEEVSRFVEEIKDEIMEALARSQRDAEEKMDEGQQDVIDAIRGLITGLQKNMEQKLRESHNTLLQRFIPLVEDVKFIKKQIYDETILILGGQSEEEDSLDSMLILKGKEWAELPLKLPKNFAGGAVFLHGEIYIFGGPEMDNELYKLDNKTFEWKRLADMNEGRTDITNSCLEWNGSIWIFGGCDGTAVLKSVERYDPNEDKWIQMPDMQYPRSNAAVTVHNDKLIVCGGWSDGNSMQSIECFDPESGIWSFLNHLPSPCCDHVLVSFENGLIAIGGNDGTETDNNSALKLDDKGIWKKLPPMKHSRRNFSAAVLDKEIYAIGGEEQSKVEIFDGENWKDGPILPNNRHFLSSLIIPIYFAETLCNYSENTETM